MKFLMGFFENWKMVGKSLGTVTTKRRWTDTDTVRYLSVFYYEKPKSGWRKFTIVGPSDDCDVMREAIEPHVFEWLKHGADLPKVIPAVGGDIKVIHL